jgi:signal transduction histidine kinase
MSPGCKKEIVISTENVLLEKGQCEGAPDGGKYTCLSVSDTGVGMLEEDKGRIFEANFTTKGRKGMGFGLYNVFETVKKHGGFILVESEEGRGATFKVFLPCSSSDRTEKNEEK